LKLFSLNTRDQKIESVSPNLFCGCTSAKDFSRSFFDKGPLVSDLKHKQVSDRQAHCSVLKERTSSSIKKRRSNSTGEQPCNLDFCSGADRQLSCLFERAPGRRPGGVHANVPSNYSPCNLHPPQAGGNRPTERGPPRLQRRGPTPIPSPAAPSPAAARSGACPPGGSLL